MAAGCSRAAQGTRGWLAPSGPDGSRRASTLPRSATALKAANSAQDVCHDSPLRLTATAAAPAAAMPRLVPVLMIASAESRVSSVRRRLTMLLNGVQAKPALAMAITMPPVRTGRLGAQATSAIPVVASPSPISTGGRGPLSARVA